MMSPILTRLTVALILISSLVSHAQPVETDLRDLISRYRESRAETTVFLDTRSTTSRGIISQNGQDYEFESTQRESGQIRYELTKKGQSTTVQVFDGKAGWLWIAGQPDAGARELTNKQLRFFRLNCGFHSPLDQPERFGFRIQYEGLKLNDESQPEHLIRLVSSEHGDVLEIWIDAYTFLEKRRAYRPAPDQPALVTTFSNYKKVEGLMFPFDSVTTFQGQTISKTRVLDIKRNAGMLSFYFTKPSSYQPVEDDQG